MEANQIRRRVNYLLVFFILALVISGVTAVPLKWEIDMARPKCLTCLLVHR